MERAGSKALEVVQGITPALAVRGDVVCVRGLGAAAPAARAGVLALAAARIEDDCPKLLPVSGEALLAVGCCPRHSNPRSCSLRCRKSSGRSRPGRGQRRRRRPPGRRPQPGPARRMGRTSCSRSLSEPLAESVHVEPVEWRPPLHLGDGGAGEAGGLQGLELLGPLLEVDLGELNPPFCQPALDCAALLARGLAVHHCRH